MAFEARPGDTVAWPKKPEDSDKAPDFKGTILVHRDIKAGERISLALWKKPGKNGTFLSGKVEDIRATPASTKTPTKSVDDDSIPW